MVRKIETTLIVDVETEYLTEEEVDEVIDLTDSETFEELIDKLDKDLKMQIQNNFSDIESISVIRDITEVKE